MRCRELSRFAYLNFRDLFPRRADRIKADISNTSLRSRLEREEEIHDAEKASGEYMKQIENQAVGLEEVDAILQESHAVNPTHSSSRSGGDEDAIGEIQALIRGNLVRRQSSRYSVFTEASDYSSKRNGSIRIAAEGSRGGAPPVSPVVEKDEEVPHSLGTNASPVRHVAPSPDKISTSKQASPVGGMEDVRVAPTNPMENEFNFTVGMVASIKGKDPPLLGTVQFVGQTTFASGYWIGLRLDAPVGKNDGSVQDTQYFKCPPLHGLFVRPEQLIIVSLGDEASHDDTADAGSGVPLKSNAEFLRETLNIAYALKHKLAHTMNIMNQQIEAIENFEARIEGDGGVPDHVCSHFLSTISECHAEEERVCREFGDILPAVSEYQSK